MNIFKKVPPLKIIIAILIVCIFIAFGIYFVNAVKPGYTAKPVITIDQSVGNKFSVKATTEDFLKGVSATDMEDGDITSSIIIESFSQFVGDTTRIVTYVACDSDNNVTKLQREITYTDYTPPVIAPANDLKIQSKKIAEVLSCFKATDVIDGDITNKIKIDELDLNSSAKGIYPVTLSVSNSCGDVTTYKATVQIDS